MFIGNEKSEELKIVSNYFFSSQCLLTYLEEKKEYESFAELIVRENVKKEEYSIALQKQINYLIEKKYLIEDVNGCLKIRDIFEISILKELYLNDYVEYWNLNNEYQEAVERLYERGMIILDASLLSIQEARYFNYILNNHLFGNSIGLRNVYLHGSNSIDERKNEKDYYKFLKLIVLLVIKINDEVCTMNKERYKKRIAEEQDSSY